MSSFFRLYRAAETLLPRDSSFAASLSACCRLCRCSSADRQDQYLRMPGEHDSGCKQDGQPLVRINWQRIAEFDSTHEDAMLVGEDGHSTERAINVQP